MKCVAQLMEVDAGLRRWDLGEEQGVGGFAVWAWEIKAFIYVTLFASLMWPNGSLSHHITGQSIK